MGPAREPPLLSDAQTFQSAASRRATADASDDVEMTGRTDTVEVNEYGLPIIWTYEAPQLRDRPEWVQWIRVRAFRLFLLLAFGGCLLHLLISYLVDESEKSHSVFGLFNVTEGTWGIWKDWSIPLFGVIFTWWHVWLGIQMCFYPVEFVGCLPPVFGWQGIVPRRAEVMASRSCDIMIGRLLKVEEIIDRIEPVSFFRDLDVTLRAINSAVLEKLANMRAPELWKKVPDAVKRELEEKVMETAPKMFEPVIKDVKANINNIVDVKQMAIEILVNNKPLLCSMFQDIGAREFTFIQHFSAVLGFLLGCFQLLLYKMIGEGHEGLTYIVLPVSGLIIGYATNWLGINLIFSPVEPHIFLGGRLNIQGVFLKRQQEVSVKMTHMIVKELVCARKMMEFVATKADILEKVLEIFKHHIETAIDDSMSAVRPIVNVIAGKQVMVGVKQDVISQVLDELPQHTKKIEEYMDARFNLAETMSYRLAHLPPKDFEGMLHPVFQEDEWMVLLLGGVLGVLVSLFQAWSLGA
eukprot:TRINITY_DN1856_c0_g1_i1.p1 TRINITY_DN1856_c0_g1~~TRINITY_DN1856_c0_g1_i1.p1  ORF type:complete len:523 (+),score=150.12 TRINITY_DN1856_c0_g1_i1:59-1627(+)